ncbi:NAD(P)-dependent oxidoreductase [Micromonospora sp. NPDC050495]|uniref:NAD-dependent epimerase/dehydratase family protein n=1 Tax=Micromonospora sp. NPDC050495 TaxID=3154936 RepID=UPI00340A1176
MTEPLRDNALPRRVVVTGAAGKLGRAVVAHLRRVGVDVLAVDRTGGRDPRDVAGEFLLVDLTDYGQVVEALTGAADEHAGRIDAVVHLAAVPAPGLLPNATTFANNSAATYHVFAAARAAGIKRVVWASSETVLGLPFDTPPPYAPVDEEYPPRPESTYSLNKALEEEMARHFSRWDPELVLVGLRFSNVMGVEDYAQFPSFDADPRLRRWNLWGYIDARDGAQAVERALRYDRPGAEVFIIANADTVMSRSSASLMAEVYPGVEVRRELGEHETLLSIDKARRLLGYQPRHSWRDHVDPAGRGRTPGADPVSGASGSVGA